MSLLELREVTKTFTGVTAIDNLSLAVPAGAIVGLIGPNGAGKTTLVNLVTGYLEPDRGDITFEGRSVARLRPHRLAAVGVARTYQNLRLFEHSTVLENVLIGRHLRYGANPVEALLRRRSDRVQRTAATALLERVGLGGYQSTGVDDLPYGLRRRVEIARALATEPKLLLLDEPAAGASQSEADEVGAVIRALREEGVTILLVEHNVRLVTAVCDSITVVDFGRHVATGPPDQVWSDPRVRAAYLGTRREGAPA